MTKRISIKCLFVLCTLSLMLASCTDTSPFFDDFSSKSENEKMMDCLHKAIRYVQSNEENMIFMKARGYKPTDLKYGLSRRLGYQGKLMLQIPVIRGRLTSARVSDALTGHPNRAYALFVFDQSGRVVIVDYVEQIPTSDYRKHHDGELFYPDFQGVQDEYSEQGKYLGYYNVRNAATRLADEGEDSIPADSSCIDGGDLPGAEIVAPYPTYPDNPFKDDNAELDSLASGDQCPACGANLEFDADNGETYCPSCGNGNMPSYGGGGGGGSSSGSSSGNGQPFDASKAVAYIKGIAQPYYTKEKCGHCARAVRQALEKGGIDTTGHPLYAKDYGPCLLAWGFEEVSKSNYTPKVGDVRVFQNPPGTTAGHIDIYGGDTWYSDYKEHEYPGPNYKNVEVKIYRNTKK